MSSTPKANTYSDWAKIVDGKLVYGLTDKGDRIMDFSHAGYAGGGTALPTEVPVRETLSPSSEDDSDRIQAAIDRVSEGHADSDGFRGAIKLSAGTFRIERTIHIKTSGVVLIGEGSGDNGTIVEMAATEGNSGFLAFQFGVSGRSVLSNTVNLTSSYIKSGGNSVYVSNTEGFAIGQRVQMSRNVTSDWIAFLGMDDLGSGNVWLPPGTTIETPRTITRIDTDTKRIYFDAPITDSFDSTYLGKPVGTLSRADYPNRISSTGMRDLRIKAPIEPNPSGTKVYSAVDMENVINGFLSNVVGQETQNAFSVSRDCLQITFDHVINEITTVQTAGGPTADFSVNGTQVLLNKCETRSEGTWAFGTSTGVGPTVLLNFKATKKSVGIAPHQRWYTGILVDNAALPNNDLSSRPGIAFTNRESLGSGHGWTTAWSVAWNVTTPYFKVQAAPGTLNWCIGCIGTNLTPRPVGVFDALGTPVTPPSLYLQQLKERKGIEAVNAIGYESTMP